MKVARPPLFFIETSSLEWLPVKSKELLLPMRHRYTPPGINLELIFNNITNIPKMIFLCPNIPYTCNIFFCEEALDDEHAT